MSPSVNWKKIFHLTELFWYEYLAIDNDWAVDVGADEGSGDGIEITFKTGSGIAYPLTYPFVRILPSIFQFFGVILDLPKMTLITWQLIMTRQLTLVPMRALQRASKIPSRGEAELQTP